MEIHFHTSEPTGKPFSDLLAVFKDYSIFLGNFARCFLPAKSFDMECKTKSLSQMMGSTCEAFALIDYANNYVTWRNECKLENGEEMSDKPMRTTWAWSQMHDISSNLESDLLFFLFYTYIIFMNQSEPNIPQLGIVEWQPWIWVLATEISSTTSLVRSSYRLLLLCQLHT